MEGRIWTVLVGVLAAIYVMNADDKVSFPTDHPPNISQARTNSSNVKVEEVQDGEGRRGGKHLLDWLGLGIGTDTDPYLARANSACLEGDLAECFKSRALSSLDDFFTRDSYELSEHSRVVRMPGTQLRRLVQEPFEYSNEARETDSEWDQFAKFIMRKVERFIKSSAIEVSIPDEILAEGRYAPRFIDEISEEINILENKSDNILSRHKLKKLFIPMLIILKLFKLKLLLFLPLILGLASFKKLLGFLAIAIPGLIGFFKLCKPDLHQSYGSYGHSSFYRKPQFGHRPPSYLVEGPGYASSLYTREQDQASSDRYPVRENYQFENHAAAPSPAPVAFRDDAQDHAYQAYREYQKK
ncbi:uncharacterized protein LOC128983549 isoform X2 [Macrosteles quadrilineatus]|nr:uncharacterized protein LOC128983549 isoform X2 [Macrosteles quadrilineatus]XP_054258836.1 uncharacterized protein LOC128983549 isoform X2 [Macrosteles quadrilineatus]